MRKIAASTRLGKKKHGFHRFCDQSPPAGSKDEAQ